MSNKSSFESRIMDFFTNASFERVDLTFGLVKEIHKRRKLDQAEETKRVASIAAAPHPSVGGGGAPKVRRKRRTKAQIEAATQASQSQPVATSPPTAASA
jgi:hypothetical protein